MKLPKAKIILDVDSHLKLIDELTKENQIMKKILKLIAEQSPRADASCEEPGITLVEAACRQLKLRNPL